MRVNFVTTFRDDHDADDGDKAEVRLGRRADGGGRSRSLSR